MIDRIHVSSNENGIGSCQRDFFYTIHSHKNWRAVIHLSIGSVQGNDLRGMLLDGPTHTIIPKRIVRHIEHLFPQCFEHNSTSIGRETVFFVIVGRSHSISMQGICPIEGHILKVHTPLCQHRHVRKAQVAHIPALFFGLDKHWHAFRQSLGGAIIKMVKMMHMSNNDRLHRNYLADRNGQIYQRIG